MKRKNCAVFGLAAMVLVASVAHATIWPVPEFRQHIQDMVEYPGVVNGDTISVWGDPLTQPPYTYMENVDYLGKSIFVVNRSFLPGQTGYDSSWEWVVIDGMQNGLTASKSPR